MSAVTSAGHAPVGSTAHAVGADAARLLFERHSRRIFTYCVRRLRSREEAEDAVQATFLNALRALRRGVVPQFEAAWLLRIAENVCLERSQAASRRSRVETSRDLNALQDAVAAPERPEGELADVAEALARMPENQRRAILLREWQGLSYREIADALGLSKAAVETLIFRARRTLARELEVPAAAHARRRLLDLGSLVGALKALLPGGAGLKAATAAVAVTCAVVLAAPPLAQRPDASGAVHGAADAAVVGERAATHAGVERSTTRGRVRRPTADKDPRNAVGATRSAPRTRTAVADRRRAVPSRADAAPVMPPPGRGRTDADALTATAPPAPAAARDAAHPQRAATPSPQAAAVPAVTAPPAADVPPGSAPELSVPTISVSQVPVPTVSVPTVSTPSVSVGSVSTPSVSVGSVSTPAVSVPGAAVPSVSAPSVSVPSVSVPGVSVPPASVPSVTVSTPTVATGLSLP